MARSIRTAVSVPEELYADLRQAAELGSVSTARLIGEAMRLYRAKQGATLVLRAGSTPCDSRSRSRP
jgi:hypothetical protein